MPRSSCLVLSRWQFTLALVLVLSNGLATAQLGWRNVDPGEPFESRPGPSAEWPPDGSLIHAGGLYRQTMWRWDGSRWSILGRHPAVATRLNAALTYDRANGQAVLFAGYDALRNRFLDETWTWDGTSWAQASPSRKPSPRSWPWFFVYDSRRSRAVLHGGITGNGVLWDTWEWTGHDWIEAPPSAGDPPPRWFGAGAFDVRRGVTILFGGCDMQGRAMNDLWEWDGSRWTSRAVSGTWPSRRFYHAMAYDARRGVALLAGGTDPSRTVLRDLWEWDGKRWTPRTDTPLARARAGHSLVYNSARGVTTMLGGGGYVVNADPGWSFPQRFLPGPGGPRIWDFDGATWTERRGYVIPYKAGGGAGNVACAYDSRRRTVVLFDVVPPSEGHPSCAPLDGTWEWSDGTWTRREPPSRPLLRLDTAMAFDERRGVAVLFGGHEWFCGSWLGDTWEWDGSDWRERPTGGSGPMPRGGHSMTYDSWRGVTVLVGGEYGAWPFPETWEWDGTSWRLAGMLPVQEARVGASLAFDRRRGVAVLFGGRGPQPYNVAPTNVFEWDGTTWVEKNPAGPGPSSRSLAGFAFDERRGVLVLSGGEANAPLAPLSDTWEWDGTTWTQAWPAGEAPEPGRRTVVYDRNRDVLFVPPEGGRIWAWATAPTENDTWVLEDTSRLRVDNPVIPPGGSATLTLRFPQDAGRPYVAAASLGIYPGIRAGDGRIIPLNLDAIFLASVGANTAVFMGFAGVLDGQGEGSPIVNAPGSPALSGLEFYVAGVSLAPPGLRSISNPVQMRIR